MLRPSIAERCALCSALDAGDGCLAQLHDKGAGVYAASAHLVSAPRDGLRLNANRPSA